MLNKRILVLIFLLLFLPLVGCLPSPAPPITENQAPTVTSIPITAMTVGETYVYDVEATDPNGDTLTYSLTVKPTGMVIDPATGLIKWTPTAKGNYAVVVKVSDGALDIIQSFTVVVSKPSAPPPVNHAPIITSIPNLATVVGIQYTYTIEATDPDGDKLTYSLKVKPDGMNIIPSTGKITWTPGNTGSYDVTVKVSDGEKATTQSFTITVEAVKLTSIVVNPKTMDLIVGEFEAIESVTAHYSDWSTFVIDGPGYDYGCSSSNNSIVTVSVAHVVEAVAEGTATITVGYTEGGITETDTIKVTVKAVELTGIEVSPDTMTLLWGNSQQITVIGIYSDESTPDITSDCIYDCEDSVATVSPDGLVTAIGFGKATITITYTPDGMVFTDTAEVTVKVPTIIIDGILSLGEWDGATEIPIASGMGTVRVLATADYLYVSFDVLDSTDARLDENLHGNDQTSINVNPTDGDPWGKPCDIIFQTGADFDAFTSPVPDFPGSSGQTDSYVTEWCIDGIQLDLPGDLETKTLYSVSNRVSEWKIPLASINPAPGDFLKVAGAIDVGDQNSYVYPIGLDPLWADASTYEDICVY